METMIRLPKGQTLLVMVLIFGLILLVGSLSLATVGVVEVQQKVGEEKGDQALYAARAGTEEMLYRLSADSNYGASQQETVVDSTLGNSYTAVISGDSQSRTITSTGTSGDNQRKLEVKLDASPNSGNISLAHAAQVGQGGITMGNNSKISGAGGIDGNVYSNGSIVGSNGAQIIGSAWAVTGINPSSGALTITKNAYSSVIKDCTVNGSTYSPVLPTNCTVGGSQIITPAPVALSMPQVDTAYWQQQAEAGGTISSLTLTNGETGSLGPKKITGNVTLSNSAQLTLTGTLWVYGTFTIDNNAILKLDPSFGANGTLILLDHPTDKANNGKLVINNGGIVQKTAQGGYVLFYSTNTRDDCAVVAGDFSNNSAVTAIVANNGCVRLNNNGDLVALAARQLILSNNAEITYETGLSSELYIPGPGIGGSSGFGWQLSSWKEVP